MKSLNTGTATEIVLYRGNKIFSYKEADQKKSIWILSFRERLLLLITGKLSIVSSQPEVSPQIEI